MKDPLQPVKISITGERLAALDKLFDPMRETILAAVSKAEADAREQGIPPFIFYASVVRELSILVCSTQHFEMERAAGHPLGVTEDEKHDMVNKIYQHVAETVRAVCSPKLQGLN